ncbi:hypothetical protein GIB67_031744 [Kingdonia uniflora]|uniref:Helitron helicase-like domain-containing protein n=1 Tax=Kingdonia uniflora TaxID=39325 RepID=A0A7J7NKB9_9MAGN|nr:hypothetical protein GIB67_031744 [Kingdonia uniflora]
MREYNAANAFTSLGVHMDDRVPHGRGPSSFVIHGELHHRIGALVPNKEQEASYAQLYIYNPSTSINTHHKRNLRLNKGNLFSKLYRHGYEVLEDAADDNDNFNVPAYLHYSVSTDHRRNNLPSTDEIAVILPGDGSEISDVRDIVVYHKANQGLIQISECHPAYRPMHYVLLFPTGQLGWLVYLEHWNLAGNAWYSTKKLSQWEYYCYRLFQRTTEYLPILRRSKLFQQFIVDAWDSTEENRLRYVRLNQNNLRSELYGSLIVIMTDDLDPNQIGQRVVLPSSHTGSANEYV